MKLQRNDNKEFPIRLIVILGTGCYENILSDKNVPMAYKIGVYKIVTTTELVAMEKFAPKIVQRRHKMSPFSVSYTVRWT